MSGNRLLHCLGKRFETGLQILAEMDSERATTAFGKYVEIASSLGRFYDAKSVLLARYGEIGCVITRDLEEYATVGAAFVGLPGRMQEARAEAETGGELLLIADDVAKFLQDFFVLGVHRDIAEDGEVITGPGACEMFFQCIQEL